MKTNRIAIDVSPLYNQSSQRGIGYFAKNLIDALQKQVKNNPDFKTYQINLIKTAPTKKYDLIHYPFFDPFNITLPVRSNTPTIVSVYDLMPRQFKKHFPVGVKGEIKWLIQKSRLKRVDFLITCSHYSKHIIKDIITYPEDRIYVTYGAADPSFRVIKNKSRLKAIQKKYNLPKKFVLYVGDINWNKNIPGLVKACLSNKYPLVIVGAAATQKFVPNHPWTQDLLYLQSQKNKNIVLTGFVSDQDLPYIYNLATLYCQPSFAEGFGLPLVQAMACGCPVAFSQETSVPEVMDHNGQMFNPYSQKSLKKALKILWTSNQLRKHYRKSGLNRAKFFSWPQTAIQTLSVYQVALLNEK